MRGEEKKLFSKRFFFPPGSFPGVRVISELLEIGVVIALELRALFSGFLFQIGPAETEAGESAGSGGPRGGVGQVESARFLAFRKLTDERGDESSRKVVAASGGVAALFGMGGEIGVHESRDWKHGQLHFPEDAARWTIHRSPWRRG